MYVPDAIAAQFTPEHLASLPNTDWHLGTLYNFLPALGVTVLQATHSRYVVDLNRRISEPLLGSFFSSVIAERTGMNKPIYQVAPDLQELQQRVQQFYLPYHEKLEELLDLNIQRFGKVYLLDLHSFFGPFQGHVIDLGDGRGQSCSEFLVACVEHHFRAEGYTTARNSPFSGGYITKRYGQKAGVESLQIEVRYHVYLGEGQLDKAEPPEAKVFQMKTAQVTFQTIFRAVIRDIINQS